MGGRERVMMEMLTGIKRAGADMILTYLQRTRRDTLKNTGEAMAVKTSTSDALFAKARMLMPRREFTVRAFRAVGRAPCLSRARRIVSVDVDGMFSSTTSAHGDR